MRCFWRPLAAISLAFSCFGRRQSPRQPSAAASGRSGRSPCSPRTSFPGTCCGCSPLLAAWAAGPRAWCGPGRGADGSSSAGWSPWPTPFSSTGGRCPGRWRPSSCLCMARWPGTAGAAGGNGVGTRRGVTRRRGALAAGRCQPGHLSCRLCPALRPGAMGSRAAADHRQDRTRSGPGLRFPTCCRSWPCSFSMARQPAWRLGPIAPRRGCP